MSDYPLKELNNKTPLEYANTPNMDYLAQNGECGWVQNIPEGMNPGSDVAAMSIFGYDPKKFYSGRGPLEAASLGIKLGKGDVAFRCNFVTVKDGRMKDFTSGHISTKEAIEIIKTLNKKLGSKAVKFYPGLSYRHIIVISGCDELIKSYCVPPHDITGKMIEEYFPLGPGADLIKYLMKESIMPLLEHPVNIKRIKEGKNPVSMIWMWGQGVAPKIETFKKRYKKVGAVITAVHLLKGLGKALGLDVINVPGATGFLDTNFKGKAEYALRALKKHDLVFVHIEAPDEAGHMGDVKGKIKAIEDIDNLVLGTILEKIRGDKNIRILLLPDHPTPISLMTHSSDPVPFVIFPGKRNNEIHGFNEREIKNSKLLVKQGYKLINKLLVSHSRSHKGAATR
ncbi:MAG: 2 3-bisphosphoglycerate-independent phosphoglycerate mutase [Candidatus Saganbacteria bacterium]|uniref:2 3-bisphosphoglycerate-independent phosphoglycerate mutase n=1 Tax=Candidatus Saganbacteria bacterium TaxID=2575572 RepID=A0A833L1K5_UNCSA|nr:MAG: 2 3-bisphosphoglycerate-independent phosphoglycerate mutase [Candidatus Saganbacteria bacterium]